MSKHILINIKAAQTIDAGQQKCFIGETK